jgi:hypothetical protein
MTSPGHIDLRLRQHDGRIVSAEVASVRPQASILFRGKAPEEVAMLAPMLFSLCGGAQSVAAETALQAAQGQLPTEKELSDRVAKVRCETALEHLWHMMLDWPQLCGLSRRETEFAECRRACMRAKSASEFTFALQTTTSLLLDKPVHDWLACDAENWNLWKTYSSALGAKILRCIQRASLPNMPSVEHLPQSSAGAWANLAEIDQPDFPARPSLNGVPRETGGLARQASHYLVSPLLAAGRNIEARFVARLVELAHIASGHAGHQNDWVDAASCGNGVGLARVETARGVLIHRAVVENGVVADYTVIAPTEWNFHPQGAFAREAACLAAQDDAGLLDQARMLTLSLDPCVAYEVVLEHA